MKTTEGGISWYFDSMGPGSVIGASWVFIHEHWNLEIRATTPVVIRIIDRELLRFMMRKHSYFEEIVD